jgi:hypothetical protein
MHKVPSDSSSASNLFDLRGFLADWIGVFALFFVYAGELVPGVNEPHYWTKSAHFWDSSFGRGDLFLESGNAHWLFYATLGSLASVLKLPSAVWVARFILWGMLTTGWTWMIRSLLTTSNSNRQSTNSFSTLAKSSLPLVSTLCGAGWLAGMHWGHWAGEWVVGGAEAKVAAYACIFGALGCFFRGQVWYAWLLLGLASAFHIVTGIWVIGCCVLVSWVLTDLGPARWRSWAHRNVGPLVAAVPFVAVGAIPPLAMDWGVSKEIVGEAAVIQVYGRLGHHLAPSLFAEVRWQSFGLLFAMGCLVHWFALKVPFSRWPYGLKWVVLNAWLALGIAVIGTLVDAVLGGIDRTLAAKILKFYWFRWNDVSWALGVAAPVTAMAYGVLGVGVSRSGRVSDGKSAQRDQRTVSAIAVGLLVGVGGWLMGSRYLENSEAWIPFGDKARFLSKWDDESARRQQYQDWLAVCEWIVDHTDTEGVWLTPRNQQSFKWHTHRPELACTKDMPQNSAAIVEWAKRLDDAYKLDEAKIQLPWTTQRLWELHEKYGVRYVLLDHRVPQQTLPLLPILYPPPGVTNATFSVYEFPTSPSHSTTK